MKTGIAVLLTVFCLVLSVILMDIRISDGSPKAAPVMADIDSESLPEGLSQFFTGGPGWITGTESGVAGFLGETEKGPAEPRVLTDFEQYKKIYGRFTDRSFLEYSASGFFANGGRKLYVARVISDTADAAALKLKSGKKSAITVNAVNAGDWGNRIAVRVSAGINSTSDAPTFRLEVFWFSYSAFKSVKSGKPDPSLADSVEIYGNVSISKDSPYYFKSSVNDHSDIIRLLVDKDDSGSVPDTGEKLLWCSGGSDGEPPSLASYMGSDGLDGNGASGLNGLGVIEGVSTLYSPLSFKIEGLEKALISQCEKLGDRTVIFDTALDDRRPDPWSKHESSYAACYIPWLKVTGFDSKEVLVPPGGFIAGVYARNDLARGPAATTTNEAVEGITGVERELSVQEREALSVRKIDSVAAGGDGGYYLYGASTLAAMEDKCKSLEQRRYVNYLYDTFSTKLGWISGREWTAELKKFIKISIEDFLDREWKRGSLAGSSQIEAYYVKAGQEDVIKNGVREKAVVLEIGVALAQPSEYFVFRIVR